MDSSPSLEKFPEVVQASARGDEAALRKLLLGGARVLPLGGRRDPLLEAVRGGHRNTVFLLLAAGAPLCAHGLLGNTPFEAAHHTIGLPALFPALIRKVSLSKSFFKNVYLSVISVGHMLSHRAGY